MSRCGCVRALDIWFRVLVLLGLDIMVFLVMPC
jgi:hypothetical protein